MERYGIAFPDHFTELDIERWCFCRNAGPETGYEDALGPAGHARNGIDMLWNYPGSPQKFVWTPWAERMLDAFCRKGASDETIKIRRAELETEAERAEEAGENEDSDICAAFESTYRGTYIGLAGCGSSGKTGMCAVWGIWNYICDPVNTKVFATSTSLKEAHNRVWGQVCRFWSALPFPKGQAPGKVVASLGLINGVNAKGQFVRDRGLELIAGEKKKEEDAIAKLKGFKAPRVIFLADELSDLSPALVTAAKSNLRLNALFTFIGSANPDKFADPFGLLCEPKDGWESISAADEEWESKDGYVLHFDGTRNPNIMAGKDIYPFLMTNQDFKEMKKELGENSRAFWQMVRGYWSPTGKDDAIYTEQELMKADVSQDVTWRGNPMMVAFLDPDFSSDGDGCAFMWGKLGMNTENRMMLKKEGVKYLRENKNDDEPRSFQIVRQCKKLCEELNIRSEHFGFDSTAGAGGTFGDIVDQIWAGDVFKLPFSGGASDRKIHYMGERVLAKERYHNKVTELWYGVHEFLSSGQLAGILPKHEVWKELTTRLYERRGKNIVQAEPKKDMRGRIGYSPNEADALVGLIELCRVKLRFNPSGLKHEGREGRKSKWNDFVKKQDPGSRSLSSGVEVAGLLGWD